ncbi:hypothetical protein AAFF_G00400710 [Aldrovandia affinis]|uniref:Uncharacterized protein n=1 Tax=Aldrovandia affinis TaxID=143900 RepID=A0AAD7WKA9_9TELE|nr:hypothetical protein AAFF_G00400710 [Aldrovandia affinis]
MTPLTQHPVQLTRRPAEFSEMSPSRMGAAAPGYASTPRPYQCPPAVMEMLQQLQEDNQRLQLTVMDMRRQMTSRGAVQAPPSLYTALLPGLQESPLHVEVEDTWLPPPPPLTPAPPHQLRVPREPRPLPAPRDRDVPEEYWPPPPPPVAFPDDVQPPRVPPAPPVQPHGLVEEVRERLQRMEARLSPAPSLPSDAEQYDSVPQSATPSQQLRGRLDAEAAPFLPQRGLSSSAPLRSGTESTYRGPKPSIPKFTRDDPREFSRLRLALENILPADSTERFRYQVLCDHLKFEEALLIADSYSNSPCPYSDTMASLIQTYGQPHQLSLQRIAELMEEPTIRSGDTAGFRKFALRVRALVGMLEQLGEDGRIELRCGSHVARLLRKLPQDLRATFRRYLYSRRDGVPSLMDFAEWLEYELVIQEGGDRLDRIGDAQGEKSKPKEGDKSKRAARKTTTVLHGAAQDTAPHAGPAEVSAPQEALDKPKAYCPYCSNTQHFLDQCLNFKQLTKEQKATWVKSNNRCWRCGPASPGRTVSAEAKREVAAGAEVKSSTDVLYLDRRAGCNQVLLKDAAERLQLQGTPESLILRTVREDRRELHGSSVTFKISPAGQPTKTFTVTNAFTAGSDCPHLVTPIEPVRLGPPGGPAAVKTRLGWTLQGPVKSLQQYSHQQQCLFLATTSQAAELFKQVEKLWQLDTLPYRSERLVTRSRRDKEATNLLEAKTTRVEVEGVLRYATPLLRVSNMPTLTAPPEAALSTLRGTEKRLSRDTVKAEAYRAEIMKLEKTGYATRVSPEKARTSKESWFIPHHLVTHNGKNRVVFNCSFTYKDQNLNELLLSGPNLGVSLLGVLLRFREHSTAISSDIKGMFHQRHVHDHSHQGDEVCESIERHFYVDNWLQSFSSQTGPKRSSTS